MVGRYQKEYIRNGTPSHAHYSRDPHLTLGTVNQRERKRNHRENRQTTMRSLSLLAAALFARISLAERELIFPVVHMGDAGADDDEFADFHAQVMHVNGDVTTYSVGCATEPCAGWANLPDFTYTMAIGPSSESLYLLSLSLSPFAYTVSSLAAITMSFTA